MITYEVSSIASKNQKNNKKLRKTKKTLKNRLKTQTTNKTPPKTAITINLFWINYINHTEVRIHMERKLFGTDGIRGKTNRYPMTAELALKLGIAAAKVITKNNHKRHKVIIGKDTRISGYIFEYALAAGLTSAGVDVYFVGPMPTPAIAHLTKSFRADAGIVISASHNPAGDNGIKFFSAEGFKLPDEVEYEIEQLILNNVLSTEDLPIEKAGKAYKIQDAKGRYIQYAKGTMPHSLSKLKIVLDCANGATYNVSPLILRELDADIVTLNNKPDGLNINKECGSLHPEILKAAVLGHKADIGIALDGDGDRVILVDEKGNIVDGDHILALSAIHLKNKNKLNKNTLVTTVMANIGLDLAMKNNDINIIKTKVGDRYVTEEMKKNNYNLGGEQSGHIIFSDYSTTGDGTISALQVLKIMRETNKPLSELASCMKKFPQTLINVNVKEKPDVKTLKAQELIKEIETKLAEKGRVLVRYSGTQNKCRVMIEGENQEDINNYAKQIANKIKEEIGESNFAKQNSNSPEVN